MWAWYVSQRYGFELGLTASAGFVLGVVVTLAVVGLAQWLL